MNNLLTIDPRDLDRLLVIEPEQVLGAIIRLNRGPRYHNSLNAIELMQRLREFRERLTPGRRDR